MNDQYTNRQMKKQVLMFGWELPPRISGGLGIACHGLLQGLAELDRTAVTFVLPHLNGQPENPLATFIGVGELDPNAALVHVLRDPAGFGDSGFGAAMLARIQQPTSAAGSGGSAPNRGGSAYDLRAVSEVAQYANDVAAALPQWHAPDLIHAHDWLTFPAAVKAKQYFGCPLIAQVHSTEFDRAGPRPNAAILEVETRCLHAADRIVTVSEVTRQAVIERYGIASDKVVPIHNGVAFDPKPRAPAGHEPIISFIGRITHQKGPRYFLEAAKLVLEQRPNVRFVMAGSGDLLAMAKSLAAVLGIRRQVEFPGFLNPAGVADLLARSNAYVMPSVAEPFGIGALEAMLAGVPVIVTDRCGVCEVVDDVMRAPAGDAAAIAQCVLACLVDQPAALQRAERARLAAQGLTWRLAAHRTLAQYDALLQRHRHAA
jgi:glycosyltransferase involved in cell wall biosynthesis